MNTTLVISRETRLFRVHVTDIAATGLNTSAQDADVFFNFDFDTFRSFESPSATNGDACNPVWDGFEMLFTYETAKDALLLAKKMRITLMCKHDGETTEARNFIGEGNCDLLHVAQGPRSVVLTLRNGTDEVGFACLEVEMEEVAEMKVEVDRIEFLMLHRFENAVATTPDFDPEKLRMDITTKSGTDAFERTIDRAPDELSISPQSDVKFAVAWCLVCEHFFGTTVEELFEVNGLRIKVYESGMISNTVVGTALLLFGPHIDRHHVTREEGSHLLARSLDVQFDDVAVTDDNGSVLGRLRGLLHVFNVPAYIQMRGGTNLDGEIFDGIPHSDTAPVPPNVRNLITAMTSA